MYFRNDMFVFCLLGGAYYIGQTVEVFDLDEDDNLIKDAVERARIVTRPSKLLSTFLKLGMMPCERLSAPYPM